MTHIPNVIIWSAVTIAIYAAARTAHGRWPLWWLAPAIVAPAALIATVMLCHGSYQDYNDSTHWLGLLIGPATVAFAIPIYERRALVRRHWPVLLTAAVMGSGTAILTAWGLSTVLGISDSLRLSLLPRSVSTPFAMFVSGNIGGMPEMTAVFVIVTGITGAMLGEVLLYWLPLRTALAKGALFGMGAHTVGTAKAFAIGREEGAIAGIVMILVGIINVLTAPFLSLLLS